MMHALKMWGGELIVEKFAKNAENEQLILHMLPHKPKLLEMCKLA